MIKVNWKIDEAVAGLEAILARLRDLRPAWQALVTYLRRSTQLQFASQGSRGGSPWQPLTVRYATRKERAYPGQPILRASDQLFRSVTAASPDSIVEIEPQTLNFGTSLARGGYHQRGEGRNPRRPFLVVTAEDRRQIKKIVRAHLQGQATLSGFEVAS